MVHLDVGVLGEIKRRQVIEENDKEKEKQAKKTRGPGSESSVNSTKVVKTLVRNDCCQQLWREINLRWLKTVSSTKILMGCYSHSLSLAATIMVSKNCPTIGEHVVVPFIT